MRLLIVIGAGASFDCWPHHLKKPHDFEQRRLPLANQLFTSLATQSSYLQIYKLMDLASTLRSKSKKMGEDFDIEQELAVINSTATNRDDKNTLKSLFTSRFYLHSLIHNLSNWTLSNTNTHTTYVDLLVQVKSWIEESPENRFVDIVVFNYDNLIEDAMENVYSYDWLNKTNRSSLSAYYSGNNLRIYKPHGSINWGREVSKADSHISYNSVTSVIDEFNQVELQHSFQYIDPGIFLDTNNPKNFIPAIAIPFKEKTNFDECPQEMLVKMLEALNNTDKVITIGWKGSDKHFTDLLQQNQKIQEVYVVSPNGDTKLNEVFPEEKLSRIKSGFQNFVSETSSFEEILTLL